MRAPHAIGFIEMRVGSLQPFTALPHEGRPSSARRRCWFAYNFGLERELVDQNPAIGVAKVTRERSRERVLTADELRRVWAACDTQSPHVAAWFLLRLVTAQRGGEILRMRWQDRVGEWWTIQADFVKNQQGHRVYLNPLAREILAGIIPMEGCEWVFPESLMGDFKHVSRRLARANRANVSDFRGKADLLFEGNGNWRSWISRPIGSTAQTHWQITRHISQGTQPD